MKRLVFVFLALVASFELMAQRYGASSEMSFTAPKEILPAILEIDQESIAFVDNTGNNAIDASEECYLAFTVVNTGMGPGNSCVAKLSGVGNMQGITFAETNALSTIPKDGRIDVRIPITSDMNTTDGRLELSFRVDEPNGFGTDPVSLSVATRAYVSPMLQVTDYTITGTQSATLEKKKSFDLQILLQNTEPGLAEDVIVNVTVPEGVYVLSGESIHHWDKLTGGQQKSLDYTLVANNNYTGTSIPIQVDIQEKFGKYSENRTIDLAFNQSFSSSKIEVAEIIENQEIVIASYGSRVDRNLPRASSENENSFAFIISNENYTSQNFAKVPYALNDGKIFRDYCEVTLGIPSRNIYYHSDATFGQMQQVIAQMKSTAEVNPGSNIIFYYAGHGAPSEGSQDAFLIPTDAFMVRSGYCVNLQELYDDLESVQDSRITVFLDACFSGANRDNTMMASARGVAIVPKETAVHGNLVVFSAATGDETAWPYNDEKHGMFTYYLLKKLQETSGDVSYKELYDYLYLNVRRSSNNINRKIQTPTVNPSASLGNSWESWKLK